MYKPVVLRASFSSQQLISTEHGQSGNQKTLTGVNHLLTMFWRFGVQAIRQGSWIGKGGPKMELKEIDTATSTELTDNQSDLLIAQCLAAAGQGDISAYFDLGVAYSTGSHGVESDMIEAHKWFNIAASQGHEEASWCRSDISDEMTAREIAEAQRRAREWLSAGNRKAA